jgi:hypothetical protein
LQGTIGSTGPTGAVSTTPGPTGPTGATPAIGGATTQVQYNSGGLFAGSSTFTFGSDVLSFPETSNSYSGTPTLNSDAYYVGSSGSGYFADYECLTSNFAILSQSQDQTSIAGGGFRDAQFIQQQDGDASNYTTIGQKISTALRAIVTGKFSSGFLTQYKDLVGGTFAAIGRIGWNDRGVSGVIAEAIQYGSGIASNEFAVKNPSDANEQSVSMAAVQAIITPAKAAADSTHKYRGVLVENYSGYAGTAAFEAISTPIGAFTATFNYGLYMGGATVNSAAIVMPASSVGSSGTIIEYDSNDYTNYDRTNNRYNFVVGGNVGAQITQYGVVSPSFTTVQKNAISGPLTGTVLFDTTLGKLCVYTGSAWQTITSV